MINHKRFFFLFPFTFLLLYSCSDSPIDNGNTITLSGTVSLEGHTDYSGVMIGLYKPIELDTALVRINQKYPDIGVQVSQETEFDHRENDQIYSTLSASDGHWKIGGVTAGEYNVVAEMDSFSWKYLLSKGQNAELNLSLNKVNAIYSNINSSFTFKTDVHYYIEKNIVIKDVQVEFKSNTFLFVAENISLIFDNCDLLFPAEGFVYILNFSGEKTGEIEFNNCRGNINRVFLKNSNNGIKVDGNELTAIQNSIFKNSRSGLSIRNPQNLRISKNNFIDTDYSINTVGGSIVIEKSVFYKNEIVLENLKCDAEIKYSLFRGNLIGITLMSAQSSKIQYCEFENNIHSSIIIIGNDAQITSNNFLDDGYSNIFVSSEYDQQSFIQAYPIINQNNFIGAGRVIDVTRSSYYEGTATANSADVNAKYNYWNTTIPFNIDPRIWDENDQPTIATVDYSDFLSASIGNIGLQ